MAGDNGKDCDTTSAGTGNGIDTDTTGTAVVADIPVTREEIAQAAEILRRVSGDMVFYNSTLCRPLRKAIQPIVAQARSRMFGGSDKTSYDSKKQKSREAAGRRAREREMDQRYIAKAALRAERMRNLSALQEGDDGMLLPRIADGAASGARLAIEDADAACSKAAIATATATAAAAGVGAERGAGEVGGGGGGGDGSVPKLHNARACYVCKKRFRRLHHFYDLMCPDCALYNWEKRHQSADLGGKVALVTGGRVKIGYEVVLKLLRAGAHVVVTTRFPHDCAARFARVSDSGDWLARLEVYGLDLRDLPSVRRFCTYFSEVYGQLSVLIHNACQTIRRPAAFYRGLVPGERESLEALPPALQPVVERYHARLDEARKRIPMAQKRKAALMEDSVDSAAASLSETGDAATPAAAAAADSALAAVINPEMAIVSGGAAAKAAAQLVLPAERTQVAVLPEDAVVDTRLFPKDAVDVNGQQVDLRDRNTWIAKLEEVQMPEVTEVFAINTISPFVMNGALVPIMAPGPAFIINVSAMEGKFYRVKSPYHPHTNMAKAALNMMTRTSAEDLQKQGVYMNSVDTGWVNEENPLEKAKRYAERHNFQTPIDEVDAAARILDPVFDTVNGSKPVYGQFLKDYRVTEW